MQNSNIDLAKTIFKEHGASDLLAQMIEGESLAPESEALINDIGATLLTQITEQAFLTAKSRGSDSVGKEDIIFVAEKYFPEKRRHQNPNNEPPQENNGSSEHQRRMEMVRQFNEMNDQESQD